MPLLELFRYFFCMRLIPGDQISSCVTFRLTDEVKGKDFIPLKLYSHVKE